MTDDPEVRRLLPRLCSAWHSEFRQQVARHIVEANRAYAANPGMALDSAPDTLDQQIRAFFHPKGSDQMPMTTTLSAAMSASLSPDNLTGGNRFTGGMQYHRRNGNASDQATAEEFLNAFGALPEEVQLQIFQALASHYGVGGEQAPAEDQGSTLRLPDGAGVQPGEFFENQQTTGTFAERDRLTSPRVTADARRRTARDRRQAQDAATASAPQLRSFERRFPHAAAVEVWGRR